MIPRAPSQHGRFVMSHGYAQLVAAIRHNAMRSPASPLPCDAHTIQMARHEMLRAAVEHTQGYRRVSLPADPHLRPIVAVGHQPQLFHPGVWFKNFVMHRLAEQVGGVAVHVLADNDLCRRTSIAVPAGSPHDPFLIQGAFDQEAEALPYESRTVLDLDMFRSFPQRVTHAMRDYPFQPLVTRIWPDAVAAAEETNLLGIAVARARHQLEQQWGLRSLEVPLSRLCRQSAFRSFVQDWLQRFEDLYHIYNRELAAFRQEQHIRSRMHPVPSLRQVDDWWELPFWCFTDDNLTRRPLFVRRWQGTLQLGDLTTGIYSPIDSEADAVCRVLEREDRPGPGLCIRPRALTTTLFLRATLCDLFVHGIGGGSYDRLTDRLILQIYGIEPPRYLTTTATVRLPGTEGFVAGHQLRMHHRLRRELHFHPEGFVDPNASEPLCQLVQQKQACLREEPTDKSRRPGWHGRLQAINVLLRQEIEPIREDFERRRLAWEQQDRRESILSSREFSLGVFPEDELQRTMGSMLDQSTIE